MTGAYLDIVNSKRVAFAPTGLTKVPELNSAMFPYQRDSTEFLLRCGCGGAYLDTGLGKSIIGLDWGRVLVETFNMPVLMLAPLGVTKQHEREAAKFGIDAKAIREPREMTGPRIYITNYERFEKFDISLFVGVIADEAAILKNFSGAMSRALISAFSGMKWRLALTAVPAPNDHMELGQQCMFLGVMDSSEMLSRWFIADQTQMGRYRLKKPAIKPFWEWVSSWARAISKPSDFGYSDEGFILPALNVHMHMVESDRSIDPGSDKNGQARLFRIPDVSATSMHREKRISLTQRADALAAIVAAESSEPWVLWCETNDEADALCERLPDAVEVRGSMHMDEKEEKLFAFSTGGISQLVTKARIAGFGSNWQHCARTGIVSLSFSYEAYYQLIRRFYRFGQKRPVEAHITLADTEMGIWAAIQRKAKDHETMKTEMCAAMARAWRSSKVMDDYSPSANFHPLPWLRSVA